MFASPRRALALGLMVGLLPAMAVAQTPSMEEMWQIIQQQQAEIERLKAKAGETEAQLEETTVMATAAVDAAEQVASTGGESGGWSAKTQIGGYGEHHFNHFKDKDDQVDAHRFVAYISHQYSDTVRFFSEIELEHGLSGEGKPGEVELEQAFIQWDFSKNHSLTAGQFLLPVGILNETHEPDTFYGVERNNVEKNIIPTTWWETGAMITGRWGEGFSYDVAVHSGLETPVTGSNAFKIRNGRQKSANATAEDLAFTGRLKYTGIKGLELAITGQKQQDVAQNTLDGESVEARLLTMHARYSRGPFTLTALQAEWDLDGASAEAVGRDQQEGDYLELAYRINEQLGVFVRNSRWDNNAGDSSTKTEVEQWDTGFNFWLTDHVVFKADFTESDEDKNSTTAGGDSVNLGVGWSY